jgi:hypothetical protein
MPLLGAPNKAIRMALECGDNKSNVGGICAYA